MVDLNSEIGSAATLYTPTSGQGIIDSGQIVANGIVNATGEDVALLLTPTGRGTFYSGAVYLGYVTVDGTGQAVLTTDAIPVGTLSLTATYEGNSADRVSTSSAVVITISAVVTVTSS